MPHTLSLVRAPSPSLHRGEPGHKTAEVRGHNLLTVSPHGGFFSPHSGFFSFANCFTSRWILLPCHRKLHANDECSAANSVWCAGVLVTTIWLLSLCSWVMRTVKYNLYCPIDEWFFYTCLNKWSCGHSSITVASFPNSHIKRAAWEWGWTLCDVS